MNQSEYFEIGKKFKRGDADYIMSRSDLVLFYQNPWAWKNGRTFDGNDSTKWGSMVDVAVLSPDEFASQYAVRPRSYYSESKKTHLPWNANAKSCAAWVAQQGGKEIITEAQWEEVAKAKSVLMNNKMARYLIENSSHQRVFEWDYCDSATGIRVALKAMLDMVGNGWFGDLKTSKSADPVGFKRSAEILRYDIQAAFYADAIQNCTKEVLQDFYYVVQDNSPPYPVQVYHCDLSANKSGWHGYESRWRSGAGYLDMLARYCRCLAEDQWPGYSEDAVAELNFFE